MQVAERSVAVVAVVAIIMNLSLIPLTSPFVVLGIGSLASLYMYLSVVLLNDIHMTQLLKAEAWKGIGRWRIALSVASGAGMAVTLVGVLFRFFAWPWSEAFLKLGLWILVAVGVLGLVFIRKEGTAWFKQYFLRASAVAVAAIIMLLTPSLMWFEIRHRDQPGYVEAFRNAHENPDNEANQAALEREKRQLMEK